MKIEIKNTSFKSLYDWLISNTDISTPVIGDIIHEELKWQYERSFRKYQDEKQEFEVGDEVKFKYGIGRIVKVYKLQNGKYRYGIDYIDFDYSYDKKTPYTAHTILTKKNLTKVKRKTSKNGNTTFEEIL